MSAPLQPGDLDETLLRLEAGADYKTELEQLMLRLPPDRASRLDLVLRESRGAWAPLARRGHANVLFVGNALSGTVLALARSGWKPTVLDTSPERLRYARARDAGLGPSANSSVESGADASGEARADSSADTNADSTSDSRGDPRDGRGRARCVRGHPDRLPFSAASFDLVVLERSVHPLDGTLDAALAEAARVCRSELVLVADNRWGYKRSTGHRGSYRIARDLLRGGAEGRRTLGGYRRALASLGWAAHGEYALYPDGRDYSLIANLARGAGPDLYVGPKERKNLPKVLAYRLGLFGSFTSTFAILARPKAARVDAGRSRATAPRRIDAILDEVADRTGEPRPRLEHWIATRGNSAVVLTAVPGAAPEDERGRWALHMPFSPKQEIRVRRNYRRLREFEERSPEFPAARALHAGTSDGLGFTCQRRLPGLSAAQISGETDRVRRLYADLAERLSQLVVQPPVALEGALFDELVEAKFELVLRFAQPESTRRALEAMRERARELLTGRLVPRVLYHADLRSKHVQVRPDGQLVAFLDWGSSEAADLPYFDLINLLVHERQHETRGSGRAAWDFVRERQGLRAWERNALAEYAERLELADDYCRGIEAIFPVLVGAMAEKNWDFSRPRWLQRLYAVGD